MQKTYSDNKNRSAARATSGRRKAKRRKRNNLLYYILLLFFIAIIGIVLSLTVFFKVESVVVTGINEYSEETVLESAGTIAGTNLFMLNALRLEKKILDSLIFSDKVSIAKKLPSTVIIDITESRIEFSLPEEGSETVDEETGEIVTLYTHISGSGRIIKNRLPYPADGSVILTGIDIGEKMPGDFIPDGGNENWNAAFAVAQAAALEEFEGIIDIDTESIVDIKINYQDRIEVQIGSISDISHKIKMVKHLLTNPENIDINERGELFYNRNTESFHFKPM
ncbi:MAG: FtsQ-type POTRA domain-containing protein [Oscillospiraceae bacterium]|nr:FtsQ-type POTRA domain-containing protein [Oscillospiraceae bacterium]